MRAADVPARERTRLDNDWKFTLADAGDAQESGFDDANWRTVVLPHDWSIEGRWDAKAPMGGAGGFLPAGTGWYRKRIEAPSNWSGQRVSVEFEGVYMNADVWLNGQHLANHPYGYTSFVVDLTPALKPGGTNVLAVRVDNSTQKNSRWYSGSGIYRHVWLTVTNPLHVVPWGVFVSTPQANLETATVKVQTRIVNGSQAARTLKVRTVLLSPAGAEVGKMETDCDLAAGESKEVSQQTEWTRPALWTPETPQLSRTITQLMEEGRELDAVTTSYGVRALAWSVDKGMLLNGVPIKLNGGCIHGDNGVLGAAAFDRAEERKIELLKATGFNEVRISHAPASPALLDACDRLGMLVMEDAFDCWTKGKNSQDYHLIFKAWWERDIDSMVTRDRNHPALIFWNIGNEVSDVYSPMGAEYSPKIMERIHALDKTRPVTNAILGWPNDSQKPSAEVDWNTEDIVGTNYALGRHIKQHEEFPDRTLVSTESSPGNPANGWSDVTNHVYVVGDNVWSAQDYLGEAGIGRWFYEGDPTEPVSPPKDPNDKSVHPLGHGDDRLYPWHGALCGDLDLLGNRKPMAHWRTVVWDKGEKLYLAVRQPQDERKIVTVGWGWYPSWENWTWPGREGKPMEAEVYSRYEKVRLYLNGEKIGESETTAKQGFRAIFKLSYQPGVLKTVGLQGGKEVDESKLTTAQAPAAIRLTADRATIRADGQDLSFVKVEVIDKEGFRQPNSGHEITFNVEGPGTIAGLGNADMKCEDPYQGASCHVFQGQALVVMRSIDRAGTVKLEACAEGLRAASISLQTQ